MTPTPDDAPSARARDIARLTDALADLSSLGADPARARAFAASPAVRAAVAAHLDAVQGLWRIMAPGALAGGGAGVEAGGGALAPPAVSPAPALPHLAATTPEAAAERPGASAMAAFFASTFGGALATAAELAASPGAEGPAGPNPGPVERAAPREALSPAAGGDRRTAPAPVAEPAGVSPAPGPVPAEPGTAEVDAARATVLAATLPRPRPAWPWGRPEPITLSHLSTPVAPDATVPSASAPTLGRGTGSTDAPPPVFEVLPPGRVGEAFNGGFGAVGPNGRRARVVSVEVPPELGLRFNAATQGLAGTPRAAGTFAFPLWWHWADAPDTTPRAGRGALRVLAAAPVIPPVPAPASAWEARPASAGAAADAATEAGDDALTLLLGTESFRLLAATLRPRPRENGQRDEFFLGHQGGWHLLALSAAVSGAEPAPASAPSATPLPTPLREGALLALSVLAGDAGRPVQRLLGAQAVAGWRPLDAPAHGALYRVAYDALCHGAHRVHAARRAAAPAAGGVAGASGAAGALVLVAHREVVQGQLVMAFHAGRAGAAVFDARHDQFLPLAPDAAVLPDDALFGDATALARRLTVALVPRFDALALGAGTPLLDDPERWPGLGPGLLALLRRAQPEPAALEWLQHRRPPEARPADLSLLALWPG